MADLDVQPKKRSPSWIWVIVILVVLGVIFTLYRGYHKSYHPTELKTSPDTIKKVITKADTTESDSVKTDTAKMDTTIQ